jgi:hypothetical protein
MMPTPTAHGHTTANFLVVDDVESYNDLDPAKTKDRHSLLSLINSTVLILGLSLNFGQFNKLIAYRWIFNILLFSAIRPGVYPRCRLLCFSAGGSPHFIIRNSLFNTKGSLTANSIFTPCQSCVLSLLS